MKDVKKSKSEEMARIAEFDVVPCRPLNEVRWLSRHFAVKGLIRIYEALVQYFSKNSEDENYPAAKYCLKMLQNPQIRVVTAIMNYVLAELAEICCAFQRNCITPLKTFEFSKAKIGKLRAQYLGYIAHFSPEVTKLLPVLELK
jgi:hypothetical protein